MTLDGASPLEHDRGTQIQDQVAMAVAVAAVAVAVAMVVAVAVAVAVAWLWLWLLGLGLWLWPRLWQTSPRGKGGASEVHLRSGASAGPFTF